MKYYIQRQLNEYGPYTLADLQRYVAQGNILLTDLARSEGMTDWVPVSQVIGNIPVPVPAAAMPVANPAYGGVPVYGGGTGYPAAATVYGGAAAAPAVATGPIPTDFHWALVLLLGIVTCGLFNHAWMVVEAAFTRKLKPESKGLLLVILGIVGIFFGGFMNGFMRALTHDATPYGSIFTLAAAVVYLVGAFQIRSDLEDYYNTVEPINLRLSGVMTFFFSVYYFQYHFSRIANWKKTGYLQPQ